jgi:hypothetical protein
MAQDRIPDEKKTVSKKPAANTTITKTADTAERSAMVGLQQQVGNRAVQHLLAQRSGNGPYELDEATEGRINRARGGGQPLEAAVQTQFSQATGQDFSGVRVHASPESDVLNRQLGAKAFTTGQDIFFQEGTYDPHSGSGKELIAHELTHVVQQSSGVVAGGSSRMTVGSPDDAFEKEAEATARAMNSPASPMVTTPEVQRKAPEEDEEIIQRQEAEEEEEVK